MKAPARVLYVAHPSPPAILSAARRTAGMTKYLSRIGYELIVLTSLASGSGAGVPEAALTIRTRDLLVSGMNPRRRSFRALASEAAANDYEARPSRLAEWVVPDLGLLSWVPFALPPALELARRGAIDCVLTSGPPHSVHVIGLTLRRHGVPWVADLRDGWTFESSRPRFALAPLRALDSRLERQVVTEADQVQAVTEPITDDLRARFGVDAVTITNGFDPDELREGELAPRPDLLDPDRQSLVYTGTLAFNGLSPGPLLAGLRELYRRDPERAERLEVVFAGPTTSRERELIEAPELRGLARSVGALPRHEALALQRAADGLLVVTQGSTSIATGKLFEYLAAGVPILVLGEQTAAARIVERTGSGLATSATDPDAIADGLARISAWNGAPDTQAIRDYSHPVLAGRLGEQIERARAAASTGV
ncbi:MAG TPA: glycosyltransferase [Thermoleophilaceae bacterium]|nr:glycosyltransferase [Thermoleophilaceae bacterium]